MSRKLIASLLVSAIALSACMVEDQPSEPAVEPDAPTTETTPSPALPSDAKSHECLSKAMYFEARGTGERGMRAVGEVLINRMNSRKFPNTICGVLNQRYNGSCQFSFICDGIPDVYREPNQKAISDRLATELLTNRGTDITNGALFFHAERMNPGWFATLSPRGRFGRQLFYR